MTIRDDSRFITFFCLVLSLVATTGHASGGKRPSADAVLAQNSSGNNSSEDPAPQPAPAPSAAPAPDPAPAPAPTAWNIPTTSDQWTVPYTGYGYVNFDAASGVVLSPQAATQSNETHAALALAKKTQSQPVQNFKITLQVSTEQQLRTPTPNGWECFWLFFNYTLDANGKKKTNYFTFKPEGIELGTAADELAQKFLYTANSPKLHMGQVSTWVVTKQGLHIDVSIDGISVMSYNAAPGAIYDVPGAVGLYTEDARVRVSRIEVQPL